MMINTILEYSESEIISHSLLWEEVKKATSKG